MANTVTIDERDGEVILHVKYGESICSDCHTRQLVDSLNKELDAWRKKASALEDERDELMKQVEGIDFELHRARKERDELKAKYEDAAQKIDSLEGEVNELQEKLDLVKRRPHFGEIIEANDAIRRLKDAERCIDEIMLAVDDKEIKNDEDCVTKICKIVESYRKKKGCAK